MNKYYLMIAIGPVQGFITASRKTRDLYAGSLILSDTIKSTMTKIGDKNIIFPDPKTKQPVPNKILAKIETDDIQEYGDSLEQLIYEHLTTKSTNGIVDNNLNDNFKKQILDYFEVFWTAIEASDDYADDYKQLVKQLSATKNERPFLPFSEPGARKCSLISAHNALFYKGNRPGYFFSNIPAQDPSRIHTNQLNTNEALGAVAYFKRTYSNTPFPSTSDIALLHITQNKDFKDDITEYFTHFATEDENGHLLYKENLRPAYIEKNDVQFKPGYDVEMALEFLEKLKTRAAESQLEFTPYYCLLVFDADNMGRHMSGDFLQVGKDLKAFHTWLPRQLSELGAKLQDVFENNPTYGKIIYAGGDDFMAFVNFNAIKEVTDAIHNCFDAFNSDPTTIEWMSTPLEISAGIAIAHYKEPLSEVIAQAFEFEKRAKRSGKNSFCMGLIKRSGSTPVVTYPWRFRAASDNGPNNSISVLDQIYTLHNLISTGKISSGYVYKVQSLFNQIGINNTHSTQTLKQQLPLFIHRAIPKTNKKAVQTYTETHKSILNLLEHTNLEVIQLQENVLNTLLIIDFINRKY